MTEENTSITWMHDHGYGDLADAVEAGSKDMAEAWKEAMQAEDKKHLEHSGTVGNAV